MKYFGNIIKKKPEEGVNCLMKEGLPKVIDFRTLIKPMKVPD